MILFGAGSSVPLDIPDMKGLKENFKKSIVQEHEISDLVLRIENAISESESLIGHPITWDLESLLSVLNYLSNHKNNEINIPSLSILLREKITLAKLIDESNKNELSLKVIRKLKQFIYDSCMEPINRGIINGNLHFLHAYYGPLMTVFNGASFSRNVIENDIKRIFSTNWDLCFKYWVDYLNYSLNDGTNIDAQGFPILDVNRYLTGEELRNNNKFVYVPLHGALDLFKEVRQKKDGRYEDIFKSSNPSLFFGNKEENIDKLHLIYPLEAIGYKESIKSPYLDLLYYFKQLLTTGNLPGLEIKERNLFIIGYSMRDPTIGSILEEVAKYQIRQGNIQPLSSNYKYRINQAHENKFNIYIFTRDADTRMKMIENQNFKSLSSIIIPIIANLPKVSEKDFKAKYENELSSIIGQLTIAQVIKNKADILKIIKEDYELNIPIS